MPLLGKFSRGSSTNSQTPAAQVPNGYQSTSRGSKPPTTGPTFVSSTLGNSQTTPSAQGTTNLLNFNYPRKSSRSPSSFFPILPRRMSPQTQPPYGTSPQPSTTRQTQAAPLVAQPPKSSQSNNVPFLETRATEASRPSGTTSTWRNLFSRSTSRDKAPNGTSSVARPLTPSRAPSPESLVTRPNTVRQQLPVNRVFEGVHETKAIAVHPPYASSASKSSLTSGSVPSLVAESTPKSTMRSQIRMEASVTTLTSYSTPVPIDPSSQALVPPVKDPPVPPPAPPPSVASEAFPQSNTRLAIASATGQQRKEYIPPRSGSPTLQKSGLRNTAHSSPHYVAAQPQSVTQVATSPTPQQLQVTRTADSGSRDRRISSTEHASRKMEIGSSLPQQAVVSTRRSTDTTMRTRNILVAENPLALVTRNPNVDAKRLPGGVPPNGSYAPESRALTTTQASARHRYDSSRSQLQVVTSHTVDEDEDDLDDLLTPSSLASDHGWDPASSMQFGSKTSKHPPKLLDAAPSLPAETVTAIVRKPDAMSSSRSLVIVAGQPRMRADSIASSATSSSVSSEVVIASPLALVPRNGSATVVPSPASSAFPPMITREEGTAAPGPTSLELVPRSIARPLQRRTSTPDPEEDKRQSEMIALLHSGSSTALNGATNNERPPSGTLAIEPAPASMADAASGQIVLAKTTIIPGRHPIAAGAGMGQTVVQKVEDNSNNRLSLTVKSNAPMERVSESRAVIVGAAKPSIRDEEHLVAAVRFTHAVGRRRSRDTAFAAYPLTKGRLETRFSISHETLGAPERSSPPGPPSGVKMPPREIEAPLGNLREAQLVARRGSKEVTTAGSPQKKRALASTPRISLADTEQVSESRALAVTGTGLPSRTVESENEFSKTTQVVARRPSREVAIGSRTQARASSDAPVARPSQQVSESSSLAMTVARGTPNVESSVKEAPPKPPVVRRPSQDTSGDSSPARTVTETVKAIAGEEHQTSGNRSLAQRAPRRLSITVPKPPALNAVLSPVSSEASQPVVHSIQPLQPPPPVASPPLPPKVIEPAPKAAKMESAVAPLPATPSVLPAPPPTPQAELALARARAATNIKSPAKGEKRKEVPALTAGSSGSEAKAERALLQPPLHVASRARSPSPLAQELPTPATEERQVVAAGSISRSGLKIDALASALSPAGTMTPAGPLAIHPSTGGMPDRHKSSEDKTRQAAKPPTSSPRNASGRESPTPRGPRQRIESTPPSLSNAADSGHALAPPDTRTKNRSTRSNTLDDFTAHLTGSSAMKPRLAITQSPSVGEENRTDQVLPAPQNKRPSRLSSTRPSEQRRLNEESPSHSMPNQALDPPRKIRTPPPTDEPPIAVRRGRTSPVPVPPPPEFRPRHDSSPPRRISEDSSASDSHSPSMTPPPRLGTPSRTKPARASVLPTPPSSSDSIPQPTRAPAPIVTTSASASTGRVWRSRRSGAPSALNALSPSLNAAAPAPIPRGAPSYATQQPSTPRPSSRPRELSLPSSSSPSWGLYPSYSSVSQREARLEKVRRDFEEEKGKDIIPAVATKPPQPFIALDIPVSKKHSPFAFLSRSRHVRTLSSASVEAAGGSQTMGSVADAASRRSGFSDFTPPSSPGPIENVIHQWHDALDGQKRRKPGVTWDVDSGSPVASFAQLMNLDGQTDTEENA